MTNASRRNWGWVRPLAWGAAACLVLLPALAMKLAGLQTARIARALSGLGPNAREAACRFLAAMINADQRDSVLRFIARADRARRPRG